VGVFFDQLLSMKINPEKINKLISDIGQIIDHVLQEEFRYKDQIAIVNLAYQRSARNLIHYWGLRSLDLRDLQRKLGNLGLSRLARSEQHVMSSLMNTKYIIQKLVGIKSQQPLKSGLSIKRSEKLLNNHTKALLGYRSKGRRVRIMVTLPSEAADKPQLTRDLVDFGINCVRINCAHDSRDEWARMIAYVKKASKNAKRRITICMDLAGPKIRTGIIAPGPKVLKFRPVRDQLGKVIHPAVIPISTNTNFQDSALPVEETWFDHLKIDSNILLTDSRGKKRSLRIDTLDRDRFKATAHCDDTCYITTGTHLELIDTEIQTCEVGDLPSVSQYIFLKPGDELKIHRSSDEGEPALYGDRGEVVNPAHISCTYPELFGVVRKGESIYFDDGKIGGEIIETREESFVVQINRTKTDGSRLQTDKGINLPETQMLQKGLTTKDLGDLQFIASNADVVNYSFVNNKEDVESLLNELEKLGVLGKLGIILKIETKHAFDNLLDILLCAMKTKYIGVMIARRDLAVETGWENIGRIQKEILAICAAGHIPVVWATQVLENLTKKGLPSRSEITDAVTALNAECVMLNKGPYINQAVKLLHNILSAMEGYQHKNEPMLPEIEFAK